MPLIDNTFENQSALDDENNGGALPDATGGGDEGGTSALTKLSDKSKFSLDSARSMIMESLGKVPAGKLFKDGKFVFPSKLLNSFKLDNLLKNIQDSLKKGLNIWDSLKNSIFEKINNFLKFDDSEDKESWNFLQKIAGGFSDALADKIKGVLMSRIYVPDVAFLAGLMKITPSGSNIKYKNNYIRNLCIKHDMPLSLAYVDLLQGVKYSVENSKAKSDAFRAARYGSYTVCYYIMSQLKSEIKELEDCFPLPKNYNRQSQLVIRKNYENIINEATRKIEGMVYPIKDDPASIEALKKTPDYINAFKVIEEYTKLKDSLFINKEDEYMKDKQYLTIQSYIFNGKKSIVQIMKNVIVYSYSNFNILSLITGLDMFNIDPKVFGDTDDVYGKSAKINKTDLNVMAPIFSPKQNNRDGSTSLIGGLTAASKKTLIKIDEPKFISPRNVHIKSLYIYLAAKSIHGDRRLNNSDLYDRLKYPVYSTSIGILDKTLGDLTKEGMKDLIGNLTDIEKLFYEYGKSVEPYLFDASKQQYISYNELIPLPKPNKEDVANMNIKSSSGRKDSGGKNKGAKAAGGAKIDTEANPYTEILDEMIDEDVANNLIKYSKLIGMTIEEINKLTPEQKRKLLIDIFRDKHISPSEIIDSLNISEERKNLLKANASKKEVDLNTKIADYLLIEDIKNYLKNHFSYKLSELATWSDDKIKGQFTKRLLSQNRYIYHTKETNFCGYDAEGFPILGYPDSDIVVAAINSNQIGNYSSKNPCGFPASSTGFACPIIGYNARGNAVYGTPIFYPNSEAIGSDSRGQPVFAYYKDRAILDELGKTEGEINNIIKDNEGKIKKLNLSISTTATGLLLNSYKKQVQSLTNVNTEYKKYLGMIYVRPLIAYDEFGNKVFGETDYTYNLHTVDNKQCIGYDMRGNTVFEYTETGKTIIGYTNSGSNIIGGAIIEPIGTDSKNRIIYGFDTDNKPIYGFTPDAKPIVNIEYDEKNNITDYTVGDNDRRTIIGKTKDGKYIYDYDNFGNSVSSYDLDGNPVYEIDLKTMNIYKSDAEDKSKIQESSALEIYIKYAKAKGKTANLTSLPDANIIQEMLNDTTLNTILSQSEISNFDMYYNNYKRYKNTVETYNRLEKENPRPPIIGLDDYKTPILGKPLIVGSIEKKIPTLVINDDIYSVPKSVSDNANKTNILDQDDFDIVEDAEEAEREMIKSLNAGANIGHVLNLVYGMTDDIK